MDNSSNQMFCDFSHLVANEVEIETNDELASEKSEKINKPKKVISFFEAADYSNGALYDELNYCWSQTFTEIG